MRDIKSRHRDAAFPECVLDTNASVTQAVGLIGIRCARPCCSDLVAHPSIALDGNTEVYLTMQPFGPADGVAKHVEHLTSILRI
jgi:hypothetical protein